MPSIELFRGDITTLAVDAVGPELAAECDALQLARAYRSSFALAAQQGVRSIAFPAISCGLPLEPAASIAIREARAASVERVIFALFSDAAFAAYERALEGKTEWVSIVNGGIKSKEDVHRDGEWHVAAHVWIITPDGRVLLQRRSTEKENWPGYWDVSAAGHLMAGETPAEGAVRETFEEIGLRVTAEELEYVGVAREEKVLRDGTYIDREVHEIYAVQREVDPAELVLQPGEVDEVMLVPLDAIPDVEPLVPHELEYDLLREFMTARSR